VANISWSTTPTGIRSSFTRCPESRCGYL
jgi:hypothetical protein